MKHKTAIIDPKAKISSNVEIGAYSIVGPDVEIDENTIIHSHVVVSGNTKIGTRNAANVDADNGHNRMKGLHVKRNRQQERDQHSPGQAGNCTHDDSDENTGQCQQQRNWFQSEGEALKKIIQWSEPREWQRQNFGKHISTAASNRYREAEDQPPAPLVFWGKDRHAASQHQGRRNRVWHQ